MSNRKTTIQERIAALGLDGRGAHTSASSSTQPNSSLSSSLYSSNSSSATGVRDKAALFENIGGVPVPRGSFGLGAPPSFNQRHQPRELIGNRIPSSGRSPGSSPGRSPADDSANIDFSKYHRMRSLSSVGSEGEPEERETFVQVQVVPPTPAFPPPEARAEESPMEENTAPAKISASPEPVVQEIVPEVTIVTARPSTDETKLVDTGQELEIPNIERVQELEAIPESPSIGNQTPTANNPPEKSPAFRRRSLMMAQPPPSNVARRLSAVLSDIPPTPSTADTTDPSTPGLRSDTLSPESTTSLRKARSLAPSRADSVSSSSSVFPAPPSDQGEISGGGNSDSPTLETLDVAQVTLETSQSPVTGQSGSISSTVILAPLSAPARLSLFSSASGLGQNGSTPSSPAEDLPELAAAVDIYLAGGDVEDPVEEAVIKEKESVEGELAAEDIGEESSSEGEPGSLLRHEIINSSSDFFYRPESEEAARREPTPNSQPNHHRDSSLPYLRDDESVAASAPDSHAPVSPTRLRDPMAETASPARVMRELRQLGMEKMSNIVIPPKRSSVLSMVYPSISPSSETPIKSPYTAAAEPSTAKPRQMSASSSLSRAHSTSASYSFDARSSSSLYYSPSSPYSRPGEKKEGTVELSPSAASMISSGTSNTSHAHSSNPRSSVDAPPPTRSDSLLATVPIVPPRRSESQAWEAQKSSIPFITAEDSPARNLTPSPPPSFRSLYVSGRLPPSSRGPGPHRPSGKVPLIQRAVTLMSRALPPIPTEELPPRRSTSAFHVLRSRTSSKVKKKQAEAASIEARSSTSSDLTETNHGKPRMRTKSSPYDTRISSEVPPPPVPQIPPVVIVNDDDSSTPIARMFMEQRKLSQSRPVSSSNTPPTGFRSSSPSPSLSSYQGSVSSGVGPVHLFTPSFDTGIFEAFPEVPHQLPTPSVIARHTKPGAGKSRLGIMSSHSYGDLGSERGSFEDGIRYSKSDDGHGTLKSPTGSKRVDEFGGKDEDLGRQSPIRLKQKQSSRGQIPGWQDEDEEVAETGWASVSVIRRQLA